MGYLTGRRDFFLVDPTKKLQTKERLEQLEALGVEEVGHGEFGVRGVTSGIYIEMVWNESEEDWNKRMEWLRVLIEDEKQK